MVSSTSSPCASSVKVTPANFIVNRSVESFRVDSRDPVSRVFAIERPVGGTFVYSLRQPLHAFGDPAIVEDRAIAGADLQLPPLLVERLPHLLGRGAARQIGRATCRERVVQ